MDNQPEPSPVTPATAPETPPDLPVPEHEKNRRRRQSAARSIGQIAFDEEIPYDPAYDGPAKAVATPKQLTPEESREALKAIIAREMGPLAPKTPPADYPDRPILPLLEWTVPGRPLAEQLEVLWLASTCRMEVHFEANLVDGTGSSGLDRSREFIVEPLLAAIRQDFDRNEDHRKLRERVASLHAELNAAKKQVSELQEGIRKQLTDLRGQREALVAEARPGLVVALAALDEQIVAAESKSGRLDAALKETRQMYEAGREQIKALIKESVSWNHPHVGQSVRDMRAAVLRLLAEWAGPFLSAAAALDVTCRRLGHDMMQKAADSALLDEFCSTPPPAPEPAENTPPAPEVA